MSRKLIPAITHGTDILYCLSFATLVYFSVHFPEKVQGSARGMENRFIRMNSCTVLLNVFVGKEEDPDRVETFSQKIYFSLKEYLAPRLPWLYSQGDSSSRSLISDELDPSEKSRLCRHPSGCKSYATGGFIKAFLIALSVRSAFTFIPGMS